MIEIKVIAEPWFGFLFLDTVEEQHLTIKRGSGLFSVQARGLLVDVVSPTLARLQRVESVDIVWITNPGGITVRSGVDANFDNTDLRNIMGVIADLRSIGTYWRNGALPLANTTDDSP